MTEEQDWEPSHIASLVFEGFDSKNIPENVSVILYDERASIGIAINEGTRILLIGPDSERVTGFLSESADLKKNQRMDLIGRPSLGPLFKLECQIGDGDDIWAICTLFSGLAKLGRNPGTLIALYDALNGLESYFQSKSLIKSFDPTEIGLMGELVFILKTLNPGLVMRSWHSSPFSTFDFSIESHRLEVKTSTEPTRLHWLRETQTSRLAVENLTYASVYCPIALHGLNVSELASLVENEISETEKEILRNKIHSYDIQNMQTKFDIKTGLAGIKFINSVDIPKPLRTDVRILELQWKCDFNFLDAQPESEFWPSL